MGHGDAGMDIRSDGSFLVSSVQRVVTYGFYPYDSLRVQTFQQLRSKYSKTIKAPLNEKHCPTLISYLMINPNHGHHCLVCVYVFEPSRRQARTGPQSYLSVKKSPGIDLNYNIAN